MSWFLFFRGTSSENTPLLARAAAGLERLEKNWLGTNRPLEVLRFGSDFFIHPRTGTKADTGCRLVHNEKRLVCLYGQIGSRSAEDLLDDRLFHSIDDLVRLRSEEGCFGLLALDKTSGKVIVFGDHIGQRCLHYRSVAEGVAISSHDVPLLAVGQDLPPIDRISLQSIAAAGWSLDNRSLFQGLKACSPGEQVVVEELRVVRRSVGLEKTLDSDSDESLAMTAIEFLDSRLPSRGPITVEMSAGSDSRAALAATLVVASPSRITGFAEGPVQSDDVRVATELAKRAGIRFQHRTTQSQTADEFTQAARMAAFETNGNIDCIALASRSPANAEKTDAVICGDGGEIYRGNYYPFRLGTRLRGAGAVDPLAVLQSKFKFDKLPEGAALSGRLQQVVANLTGEVVNSADVLDLFYIRERFGVWNQKLARAPGALGRVGPFYSRACSAKFLHSRSPLANSHNVLHAELISRMLPSCMDLPVNRGATPRQLASNNLLALIGDVNEAKAKLARRFGKLRRTKPLEEARFTRVDAIIDEVLANVNDSVVNEFHDQLGAKFDEEGLDLPLDVTVRCLGAVLVIDMAQDIHAVMEKGGEISSAMESRKEALGAPA